MSDTHLQASKEPTPNENFARGMLAIINTTKAQSDQQLAEAADRRKQQRDNEADKTKAPSE